MEGRNGVWQQRNVEPLSSVTCFFRKGSDRLEESANENGEGTESSDWWGRPISGPEKGRGTMQQGTPRVSPKLSKSRGTSDGCAEGGKQRARGAKWRMRGGRGNVDSLGQSLARARQCRGLPIQPEWLRSARPLGRHRVPSLLSIARSVVLSIWVRCLPRCQGNSNFYRPRFLRTKLPNISPLNTGHWSQENLSAFHSPSSWTPDTLEDCFPRVKKSFFPCFAPE